MVCFAGIYFDDNAILGIGAMGTVFGGYMILQTLLGLVIDLTVGPRWIGAIVFVMIVGFCAMRGYGMLTGAK